MINPRLFFAIVTAGIFLIQFFQQLFLVPEDLFAPGQSERLNHLDGLSIDRIAAYKIKHVLEQPRYDVLILGNSSALGVQSSYFDPSTRFFNMAIPGSSQRMTTGLIDLLERSGKTPHTLVVMLTNFEFHDQQIQHMPLPWRWRNTFDDIHDGLSSADVPMRDVIHMAGRLAKEELDQFTRAFNAELLSRNLRMASGQDAPPRNPDLIWGGFSIDGSGGDMTRLNPEQHQIQELQPLAGILEGYVRLDFQRLARQATRSRVILYESPLEPSNAMAAIERQAPQALRLRALFIYMCERLALECHTAPIFGDRNQPNRWIDHYHPPASVIGPYIADLIRSTSNQGRVSP